MVLSEIGLYISFKQKDGSWTEAISLGNPINESGRSLCSTLSPDGKYLFYLGNQDGISGIYWVSIEQIIEDLRPEKFN